MTPNWEPTKLTTETDRSVTEVAGTQNEQARKAETHASTRPDQENLGGIKDSSAELDSHGNQDQAEIEVRRKRRETGALSSVVWRPDTGRGRRAWAHYCAGDSRCTGARKQQKNRDPQR
jgi:hypothetical protein